MKYKEGIEVICNLVLDEKSIRQKVKWDGKKYFAFVDIGTDYINSDNNYPPQAKNASVCLAVALNNSWKIPLGYFLIQNLNAHKHANLLRLCIELLTESGGKVYSITFDGAPVIIGMASVLGVKFDFPTNFSPVIKHPKTNENIFIFWDACHMLKLVRNYLGDTKTLTDSSAGLIQWRFISSLHELQEQERLHAATELGRRHVNYETEKMNVKLAAQTLSGSVSSALEFCKTSLKKEEYIDASATSTFCKVINNVFDILNSRNVFSKKPFGKCLSEKTIEINTLYPAKYIKYLASLKDADEQLLIKSGFLGLIICLTNFIELYKYLIENTNMKYLLGYKLSQDVLEVFFSAIRSLGGFNNNPSALQFRRAYRRLLVRHQIVTSKNANCIDFNYISILDVSSSIRYNTYNIDNMYQQNSSNEDSLLLEHYCRTLSNYVEDVVTYSAGFIAIKAVQEINCTICISELVGTNSSSSLLDIKNRGGLIKPSKNISTLCILSEGF